MYMKIEFKKLEYADINCRPSPESCQIYLSPYHKDADEETKEFFNREYWQINIGTVVSIHHSNALVDFDHPEFDYDMFDGLQGAMLLNYKQITQNYYEKVRNVTKISKNS